MTTEETAIWLWNGRSVIPNSTQCPYCGGESLKCCEACFMDSFQITRLLHREKLLEAIAKTAKEHQAARAGSPASLTPAILEAEYAMDAAIKALDAHDKTPE